MNTTRMPGLSAEASFYRSSAHYQAGVFRQGGKGIIHLALELLPVVIAAWLWEAGIVVAL